MNRKREHEGRNGMNDRVTEWNHESGMKGRHVMVVYRMFLKKPI